MRIPSTLAGNDFWLPIVAVTLSVFAMSFQDALVKAISGNLPLWQIYILRSLIAVPLIGASLLVSGGKRWLPRHPLWSVTRSILLVGMYVAFYAGVPHLSLSVIAAGYYTGPLFVLLISALVFGQIISKAQWTSIGLGFVGVLIILQPGNEIFSYWSILPVSSAFLYAMAVVITNKFCSVEEPLVLSLTLNLSFLVAGLAAALYVGIGHPQAEDSKELSFLLGPWVELRNVNWMVIIGLAFLIVAVSTGIAFAYQRGVPSVIATFDYSYLVFSVLWSYIIFNEIPRFHIILGMLLIASAGSLALRTKARRALS